MTTCIICLRQDRTPTIEHIIPRSMGNLHYILTKGQVCQKCNNRFARFEHAVLNSSPFLQTRIWYGAISSENERAIQELRHSDLQMFLIKIAFESIYKSKRQLIDRYKLQRLRAILNKEQEAPHIRIEQTPLLNKKPIPNLIHRLRLRSIGVGLYYEVKENSLFFSLFYGKYVFTMELSE